MKTTLSTICVIFLAATVAVMAQTPTNRKEDWFTFPGKEGEPPLLIHMEAKASRGTTGRWLVTQLHCEVTFQDAIGEHQLDIDFAESKTVGKTQMSIGIRHGHYCVFLKKPVLPAGGEPEKFGHGGYQVSYGISPVTSPVPAGEAIFCPAETRVKDEAVNPDRVWEIISLAEGILAIGKTWGSKGQYEIAKSNLEPDAKHLQRILNRGVWAVLKK